METTLEKIKAPINEELKQFNEAFDKALATENALLKVVHQHIKKKKGKQIRPSLTLLSAKICKTPDEKSIDTALSLELLHTASLVHDDIVDESKIRRGQQSVNAIWDNHIAVLVGDYLLSQSLQIATKTDKIAIIRKITELGKQLSEGELLQVGNADKVTIDEDKYLEVIRKKTAMLFSVCTSTGALSIDATDEQTRVLEQYGIYYGMSFQIKDDIFDYVSSEKNIGKPVGNDIKEGKITLPLIYAINNTTGTEKNDVLAMLNAKDYSTANIEKIIDFAIENGGIQYAEKRIDDFNQLAIKQLDYFPDSPIKTALADLVTTSSRRKS